MKSTLLTTTFFFTLALTAPLLPRQSNFQTFTAALGGVAATPVTDSGNADRPFQVKGDTFVNAGAALQRSCDQQFNACANLANGGDKSLSVGACGAQKGMFFFVCYVGEGREMGIIGLTGTTDQCNASVSASTAAAAAGNAGGNAQQNQGAGNAQQNQGAGNAGVITCS